MTTINITTSITTVNVNNNTDQTKNRNMYIRTKVCSKCRTIKQLTEFNKKIKMDIKINVKIVLTIE